MAQTIGQVMQNNPLVNAAKDLINYSVQLRQHGDKNYRDEIVRFQERDEISAWKKVRELYDLANPENKHLQITKIKSCLYPLYSFANTYSQDWYFVLHWREKQQEKETSFVQAIAHPIIQAPPTLPKIQQIVVAPTLATESCPFK